MMGQLSSGQERLFYSFHLKDHIPANHLLRSIDRCLEPRMSALLHNFTLERFNRDPFGCACVQKLYADWHHEPVPSAPVVCPGNDSDAVTRGVP